ncbi:MAG: S8 family serine peptidase [Geminicoccaceae bacterium]|nr:S8 family serine peptidase [Geminicoccaceae bacterium]
MTSVRPRPRHAAGTGRWGRLAALLLALLLLAGAAGTAAAATDLPAALIERADRLRGRLPVIVRLRGERPDPTAAAARLRSLATRMAGTVPFGAPLRAAPERVTALVDGERLRALAADPEVVEIVPNTAFAVPRATTASPADASPLPGAPVEAGRGALLAILDTGVDAGHPALAGRVVAEFCSSYASARDAEGRPLQPIASLCPGGVERVEGPGVAAPCDLPRCEHGTHVAAIAAGGGVPASGGRPLGWAPAAEIVAVQLFSRVDDPVLCGGTAPCVLAFRSAVLDALDWLEQLARERPIAAVNLSLGDLGAHGTGFRFPCENEYRDVSAAIARLEELGTAVVAASGNDWLTGRIAWPACISRAVAVAAADRPLAEVAPFADFGPSVDLVAPGTAILSAVPGAAGLAVMDGTSMAAPAVSGAIARLVGEGAAAHGPAAALALAAAGAVRPLGRPLLTTLTRPAVLPTALPATGPAPGPAVAGMATGPLAPAARPTAARPAAADAPAPAAAARALLLSYPTGAVPEADRVESALARALGLAPGAELVVRPAPGGLVVEATRPLDRGAVEAALSGELAPRATSEQVGAKPLAPGARP